MKLRTAVALVIAVVAALVVNAYVVTRTARAAEPFAGGHVLELDGPDLNIREYGPPGDRAVVLLHGYSASIEWWQAVAPMLARGERVIAIDLVGHGGSEAPSDPQPYTAAGQADAVRNALTALGVKHAVLVGHSMGGVVAAALAEKEPALVERVAVSDTPATPDLVALPALGKAVCWPMIGPALDRLRGVDAITESSLQTGFAAGYAVPQFAHRSLERLTYAGVCDSKEGTLASVADTLKDLDKPVLVIFGEQDVLTPTARNIQRYGKSGLVPRVIVGSGHSPMVEKPDDFVAAISAFVAGAPAVIQ